MLGDLLARWGAEQQSHPDVAIISHLGSAFLLSAVGLAPISKRVFDPRVTLGQKVSAAHGRTGHLFQGSGLFFLRGHIEAGANAFDAAVVSGRAVLGKTKLHDAVGPMSMP